MWKLVRSIAYWSSVVLFALVTAGSFLIPLYYPDALKVQPGHRFTILQWMVFIAGLFVAISILIDKVGKWRDEKHIQAKPTFLDEYSELLIDAVLSVQDIRGLDLDALEGRRRGLLNVACKVVEKYCHEKQSLMVNACIMEVLSDLPPNVQVGSHEFPVPKSAFQPKDYSSFLQITEWARDNHCVPLGFTLGVHNDRLLLSPGAAQVFTFGVPQVVGDIRDRWELKYIFKGHPQELTEALRYYFKARKSFRSFVSFRLSSGNFRMGVVNVQSIKPRLFGTAQDQNRELVNFLLPVIALLTLVQQEITDKQTGKE